MSSSSPVSPGAPPSRRDQRRARILEAAERLCAESGFAAVRMEEIATRARVSKGTLYNHFASKEDLLLAMVIARYEETRGIVGGAAGDTADPAEALEGILHGLSKVPDSQAAQVPLMYQAWSVASHDARTRDRLYGYLRQFFRDRARAIRSTLVAGQRSGAFRSDVDAGAFADAIMSLVSGFIFRSAFDPEAANARTLRAAFDALLCQVLVPPRGGASR